MPDRLVYPGMNAFGVIGADCNAKYALSLRKA
jgi:hypothetical protein